MSWTRFTKYTLIMRRRYKKIFKRWRESLSLSKRQQFVVATLLLTLELIATQLVSFGLEIKLMLLLSASAYILSFLVLREGWTKWGWITALILPAYYTAAVYLFYLLLPTRWLTRLPIAFLYAIGMYAILLTENIYNAAVERNIQLLRAAHGVGVLL